jgi:hypothetical protein
MACLLLLDVTIIAHEKGKCKKVFCEVLEELEPPCKQGSKLRAVQASVRSLVATCRNFCGPIATAKKEKPN